MRIIDPSSTPTAVLHQHMLGAVAPRPIAFVSTVNELGQTNLAPFSFFNAFSSNPPIVVFSANRRVTNNTTKDTLANVEATRECVINMVSHDIVRQMALASVEFDSSVSEFDKSGLTPIASDLVRPPRVAESHVQMECRVADIIPLGEHGGAGYLILCHILRMHIDEAVLDENDRIDPHKLDLVGRMGRTFYNRASGASVFSLHQSVTQIVLGFDQLPIHLHQSTLLTGSEICRLANLVAPPDPTEVATTKATDTRLASILATADPILELHTYIREAIAAENIPLAALLAWSM